MAGRGCACSGPPCPPCNLGPGPHTQQVCFRCTTVILSCRHDASCQIRPWHVVSDLSRTCLEITLQSSEETHSALQQAFSGCTPLHSCYSICLGCIWHAVAWASWLHVCPWTLVCKCWLAMQHMVCHCVVAIVCNLPWYAVQLNSLMHTIESNCMKSGS